MHISIRPRFTLGLVFKLNVRSHLDYANTIFHIPYKDNPAFLSEDTDESLNSLMQKLNQSSMMQPYQLLVPGVALLEKNSMKASVGSPFISEEKLDAYVCFTRLSPSNSLNTFTI